MFSTIFQRKPQAISQTGLALTLIIAMQQYVEEAEKQTGALVPIVHDVQQTYDKLVKLGLSATKNAQLLKEQIIKANNIEINKTIAENLIKFVKECRAHFGPGSILVPESTFFDILSRYRLEWARLNQYGGVIPQKNIDDLVSVAEKISSFKYANMLNLRRDQSFTNYILFVERLGSSSSDYSVIEDRNYLQDMCREQHNLLKVRSSKPKYDGAWWASDVVTNHKFNYGCLAKIYGTIVEPDSMFIACQPKFLDNPDVKIDPIPTDPIVFQFCPFGVLVHTAWGEEADDKVLKDFAILNNTVANL